MNVVFLDHLEHGLWNNTVALVSITRATSVVGAENCMVAIHKCTPSKKKIDASPCSVTSKPHIFNVFGSNHFKFSLNVP